MNLSTIRARQIFGSSQISHPTVELWGYRLLVNGRCWPYLYVDGEHYADGSFDRLKEAKRRYAETTQDLDHCPGLTDNIFQNYHEILLKNHRLSDKDATIPHEFLLGLQEAEEHCKDKPKFGGALQDNLKLAAQCFNLNETETDFLAFVCFASGGDLTFQKIVECFSFEGNFRLITEVFACATNRSPEECSNILHEQSSLMQHILSLGPGGDCLSEWLNFQDFCSVNRFIGSRLTQRSLVESFFNEAPESTLSLADFSHIPTIETILIPYLRGAVAEKKTGVNLLLYGKPGTGKTELSRLLAQTLDLTAYEISTRSPKRGEENPRLRCWKAATRCLENNNRSLILIDEAEDIFLSSVKFFNEQATRCNKAEINRLLETVSRPTIWVTNSLQGIDPAMLRRFDIITEIALPTQQQRLAIIQKSANGFLSTNLQKRLAATESLTPAVITRAVQVVQSIGGTDQTKNDAALETIVNNLLRAQECVPIVPATSVSSDIYSIDFLNTDADLDDLTHGLLCHHHARFCFYGAPGTGKSAFAARLAQCLGRPLLVKKASDLLDRYVGGTERNIAEAFAEARQQNAVLLMDEIDGFLRKRSRSDRVWESTQVTEMLTQLERFDGLFIATTNLITDFDPAALRRFDFKIQFKPLSSAQAHSLLTRYADDLELKSLSEVSSPLPSDLTPGDFAAVARQAPFHPFASIDDFVLRLRQEASLKQTVENRSPQVIGFS